jgi:hypothetical protein
MDARKNKIFLFIIGLIFGGAIGYKVPTAWSTEGWWTVGSQQCNVNDRLNNQEEIDNNDCSKLFYNSSKGKNKLIYDRLKKEKVRSDWF